jgi:protein-S-isoprenylcysteine O-methyltransferase Ste14
MRWAVPGYLAAATIVLLVGMVVTRVLLLRRVGTRAMHFGGIDKKDFFIPPVALFYFYIVFAAAFGWPLFGGTRFFRSDAVAWVGVGLCCGGLLVMLASLISFGRSFRVGIDVDRPDELVTTGVFAWSRNPIYVAFFLFWWANSWCFRTGFLPSTCSPVRGFSTVRYCARRSSCGGSTAKRTPRIADV